MNGKQSSQRKINKEEWLSYAAAWEKSGKPQPLFCKENNLPYTTFGYWRMKYLEEKPTNRPSALVKPVNDSVATPKPAFLPVVLPNVKPASPDVLQAKLLSGLTLTLPLSMPTDDMIKLLQGLGG